MSYPVVRYPFSNARGLSTALWRQELDQYDEHSGLLGTLHYEDFVQTADGSPVDADGSGEFRVGGAWYIQNSAAGGTDINFSSIADPTGMRGTMSLIATTGTDWFGVSAARVNKCVKLPTHTADPQSRVVFEYVLDLNTMDSYFIGLCEEVAEFLGATGALPTDSDYIGFFRTDSGNLLFVSANDNAGGTAVTDSHIVMLDAAITAETGIIKLGFSVNKDNTVEIQINGEQVKVDASTGDLIVVDPLSLPIETLGEYMEFQRGATADLAAVSVQVDLTACWGAE